MRVQVRFLAAIPVGNEVAVQWVATPAFGGWVPAEPIILDRTTGIIWSKAALPDTLDAASFDIERHDPKRRQHEPMTIGRVTKCHVMNIESFESSFTTLLELGPAEAAYR